MNDTTRREFLSVAACSALTATLPPSTGADIEPIEVLVRERVILEPRGEALVGLCPFHVEYHPSFNVLPRRGIFHCFGCGEGGDIVAWVMKMDQVDHTEAVQQIRNRFGDSALT